MALDFQSAIENIKKDPEWIQKSAILALLTIVTSISSFFMNSVSPDNLTKSVSALLITYAIMIIIGTFVGGYIYKYIQGLLKNSSSNLPEWNNIGNITKIGLKGLVLGFLYGALFAVSVITIIGPAILLVVLLVYGPGLIISFTENFSIKEGFNFKKAQTYFSKDYFLILAIYIAFCIISAFLGSISLILNIIITIVGVAIYLIIINLYAKLYHDKQERLIATTDNTQA